MIHKCIVLHRASHKKPLCDIHYLKETEIKTWTMDCVVIGTLKGILCVSKEPAINPDETVSKW